MAFFVLRYDRGAHLPGGCLDAAHRRVDAQRAELVEQVGVLDVLEGEAAGVGDPLHLREVVGSPPAALDDGFAQTLDDRMQDCPLPDHLLEVVQGDYGGGGWG